jgi:replicative DNA helicase
VIAPTLPHSPEHERAILAGILVGHKAARAVIDRLTIGDFFLPQNRHVFEALKSLDGANKPTDELSVFEALSQDGQLEAAGGISYLAELTKDFQAPVRLEHYVTTLKDKAMRRAIAHKAYATYEHAISGSDTAEKVLDRGIEQLSAIARDLEADRDCGTSYREAAASLLHEFDSKEGVRIFTDIDELDRLTGGFRAGEVYSLRRPVSARRCSPNRRGAGPATMDVIRCSAPVRCGPST